jgi:hypothetical protein
MFTVRALVLTIALMSGFWALVKIPGQIESTSKNVDPVVLNPYELWYEHRLSFYYDSLDSFSRITSPSTKMTMRHAFNYDLVRLIEERLRPGDTLLLPPRSYANALTGGREAIWTDVRIYRYLSGSTTPLVAWENNERHSKANIAVALEHGVFELLRKGTVPDRFDSLVAVYHRVAQ